jgi:hypothetical protein
MGILLREERLRGERGARFRRARPVRLMRGVR